MDELTPILLIQTTVTKLPRPGQNSQIVGGESFSPRQNFPQKRDALAVAGGANLKDRATRTTLISEQLPVVNRESCDRHLQESWPCRRKEMPCVYYISGIAAASMSMC